MKTGVNAAVEWGLQGTAPEADLAGQGLLTYKDVQGLLRLSRRSVVALANRGDLPRVRLLGRCLFDPADVRRLIEASKTR